MYKILTILLLCLCISSIAQGQKKVETDKRFSQMVDSLYRADTLGMSQLFSKERDWAFRRMTDTVFRNALVPDSIIDDVKKGLLSFWNERDSNFKLLQDKQEYFFYLAKGDFDTTAIIKAYTLANKYAIEGKYDQASALFIELTRQQKKVEVQFYNDLSLWNELISYYQTNKIEELKTKIERTSSIFILNNVVFKYLLVYSFGKDDIYRDKYIKIGDQKISLTTKICLDHENAEYIDVEMRDVDSDGINELVEDIGYGGSNAQGAMTIYKQVEKNIYSLWVHLSESSGFEKDSAICTFVPITIGSDHSCHYSDLQIRFKIVGDSLKIISLPKENKKIIKDYSRSSIYSICLTWYYNNHLNLVGTKKLFDKLAKKMDLHESECMDATGKHGWECFLKLKDRYAPSYFVHIRKMCPDHGLMRENEIGEACGSDDEYADSQIAKHQMHLAAVRIFLERFLNH